ncbi:MAG: alpha/beta fold hydrolase, partial [Pseudomonadota bacterium]
PAPLQQDGVVDWLHDDPEHILLGVWDLEGYKVRRVDTRNGRFKNIHRGMDNVYTWETDLSNQIRFGYGETEKEEPIGFLRQADGSWKDVSDLGWMKQEVQPVLFEDDPRYAIAVGPVNGSDTDAVVRVDFQSDEIVEVLFEHPSLDAYPVATREGKLIGYTIPALESETIFTDPEYARLYRSMGKALPGHSISLRSWTPDKQVILVVASSPQDGGTLYVWDRKNKALTAIGRAYPELDPEGMSAMEKVTYKARDGLEITAYLSVPQGVQRDKLPVVVMPHGGPYARDTLGFDFLVQMMTSRGYAVLQPNFRGSLYEGREFQEAGEGQWGRQMQDDLLDGLAWMVDEGVADPDRACIVGWSYGGYAALMGAVQSSDVFRCAASINGVADLNRLRTRYDDRAWRRYFDEYILGDDVKVSDYSPVDQAERIDIPVLIVHAKDDGRVPYDDHAKPMSRALERKGKQFDMVTIETGDHSLLNKTSRLAMLEALEAFLAANLGG